MEDVAQEVKDVIVMEHGDEHWNVKQAPTIAEVTAKEETLVAENEHLDAKKTPQLWSTTFLMFPRKEPRLTRWRNT